MGYGKVSNITLSKSDTLTLFVDVEDFEIDTLIEISGNVTQANGAVATFYNIQPMPVDEGIATLTVEAAVKPGAFVEGLAITVVARAAEAWITMLDPVMDSEALAKLGSQLGLNEPAAAWKFNNSNQALRLPEQQSQSAPQSEGAPQSLSSGIPVPAVLTRHGTWWDRRKTDRLDVVMGGRFTRLFPYLPAARFDHEDLESLADAMIAAPEEPEPDGQDDPEENKGIPAAYTYLGQFTDHDLTFDPISHLRESLTPAQLRRLVDFRTPRFDLDNLYGRGPDDQPYMYEDDGIRMLLGKRMSGKPFDPGAVQLPRGPSGRALIGDPRNDENRIVAQLHAVFLRFHNEVVRRLGGPKNVSFREVRDQVRWHYQWVLVDDFLRTILDEQVYQSVFSDPYNFVTTIPRLRENDLELMPVEFSVAAYRFGHSMIRPRYKLNPEIEQPIFSNDPGDDTVDLGGFRPIPPGWAIDWRFFINLGGDDERAAGDRQPGSDAPDPQLSYKIDTSLVHPLGNLPSRIAKDPSNLALRNLQRGATFQLPSGQQVAAELGLPVIPDEELMIGQATVDGPQRPITKVVPGLAGNTPLWAYVLSEAQVMSWKNAPGPPSDDIPIRLGPVGGRLIAEVFASLLRGDHTSYLYAEPTFKPIPEFARNGTFGLAQLINVVLGRAP